MIFIFSKIEAIIYQQKGGVIFNKIFRIVLVSIVLLLMFSATCLASQGFLSSVDSQALIREDGIVEIRQIWQFNDRDTTGTEHYINLNTEYLSVGETSLRESISDYKVSLNGEPLTFKENWNIKDSFAEKAGKYGVVDVGNGAIELCFGITERSNNEFVVEYLIHNAIKETTDGHKYLHWAFLPTNLNPEPRELTATIEVEEGFAIDKIYGFNYYGKVYFMDVESRNVMKAEMDEGSYTSNTTLNLFALIRDEQDLIQNAQHISQTMTEKAVEMLSGSDYTLEHFQNNTDSEFETKRTTSKPVNDITSFIASPIFILLRGLPVLFGAISIVYALNKSKERNALLKDLSKEEYQKLTKDKDFYYREKPEEIINFGPILERTLENSGMNENMLKYFISKWISEGAFEFIRETEIEKGIIFKKTEKEIMFRLVEDNLKEDATSLERGLFSVFQKITGPNGVLNTGDLEDLKVSSIEAIFLQHKREYPKLLVEQNLANGEGTKTRLNERGKEVLYQHVGLKNFLSQYTLIKERDSKEVYLWDYYFHLAAFYGIADKFEKELSKIPSLSEGDMGVYNLYYGLSNSALMNRRIGQIIGSNYSAYRSTTRGGGGGGRASFGGGGGFSGGGSGGGTR